MSITWRLGVSCTCRICRAICRPCCRFVKCCGSCISLTRGSDMSAFSLTTLERIETGLGIRAGTSASERRFASENISTKPTKSPGYSVRISPSSASAMRLHCTYCPPNLIEPDMSMHRTLAHLGLFFVRCVWRSSIEMRSLASPALGPALAALRATAFPTVPTMSMCAAESPNSYAFVRCISTAPSPAIGPAWRPDRAACRSLKISCSTLRWKTRIAAGVSRYPLPDSSIPCRLASSRTYSSTIFWISLSCSICSVSAYSESSSMSMIASCAVSAAVFSCSRSLSIVSSSSLTASASSTPISVRPVKAYFPAISSIWYLAPRASISVSRSFAKSEPSFFWRYQRFSRSAICSRFAARRNSSRCSRGGLASRAAASDARLASFRAASVS